MRGKSKYIVLSLVLCLSMMLFLCGCGEEKSGSTIEEPEITGKYLQEEYSQQLLTDGAETMIGTVDIEKKDDNYNFEFSGNIENQELLKETRALLATIYKNYWANTEEKGLIEEKIKYDVENKS